MSDSPSPWAPRLEAMRRVGPVAWAVFEAMCAFRTLDSAAVHVTAAELADQAGVARSTVFAAAIPELVKAGLVRFDARGRFYAIAAAALVPSWPVLEPAPAKLPPGIGSRSSAPKKKTTTPATSPGLVGTMRQRSGKPWVLKVQQGNNGRAALKSRFFPSQEEAQAFASKYVKEREASGLCYEWDLYKPTGALAMTGPYDPGRGPAKSERRTPSPKAGLRVRTADSAKSKPRTVSPNPGPRGVRTPDSESKPRTVSPNAGPAVRTPDSAESRAGARPRADARPKTPTTPTTSPAEAASPRGEPGASSPAPSSPPPPPKDPEGTNDHNDRPSAVARRILTELFRDGRSAGDALSRICSEIPAAIDPQPNSTHGEALCEFARGITNDASKKDGPQRYAHAILRKPEAIRERWAEAIAKAEKITKKRSAETIAAKASADAAAATAAARVKLEREDAFQAALDAKLASHFAVGDLVNVKGNPDNPYRLDRKTGMGAPTKDLRAIRASDTGAFKSAIPLAKLVMFTLPPEVPVRGAEAVQEFTLERLKELVAKVNNETAPAA